jgi:hypothetical protein
LDQGHFELTACIFDWELQVACYPDFEGIKAPYRFHETPLGLFIINQLKCVV